MKEFFLYNVPQETEAQFQPSAMLSAARRRKVNGGWQLDTDNWPAAQLFDKKTFSAFDGIGWVLYENGMPVGYVEKCDPELNGCDYRWYNHVTKAQATEIRLLVYGDTRYDAICENVGIQVQPQADGSVIIENITTLNGEDFRDFKTNREIRLKGFEFAVTNVSDGSYGSLRYLGTNGGAYNQLGTQGGVDSIRIAKEGYAGTADYVWLNKDQVDADQEVFAMCFIRAVKNQSQYLRVPIKDLFTA